MSLKLLLRSREKFILNGALLANGDKRATLVANIPSGNAGRRAHRVIEVNGTITQSL